MLVYIIYALLIRGIEDISNLNNIFVTCLEFPWG